MKPVLLFGAFFLPIVVYANGSLLRNLSDSSHGMVATNINDGVVAVDCQDNQRDIAVEVHSKNINLKVSQVQSDYFSIHRLGGKLDKEKYKITLEKNVMRVNFDEDDQGDVHKKTYYCLEIPQKYNVKVASRGLIVFEGSHCSVDAVGETIVATDYDGAQLQIISSGYWSGTSFIGPRPEFTPGEVEHSIMKAYINPGKIGQYGPRVQLKSTSKVEMRIYPSQHKLGSVCQKKVDAGDGTDGILVKSGNGLSQQNITANRKRKKEDLSEQQPSDNTKRKIRKLLKKFNFLKI